MAEYQTMQRRSVLDILAGQGKLSQEAYEELKAQMAKGEDVLGEIERKGLASEEDVTKARAELYGLPYIDLFGKRIHATILNIVPRDLANNYKMVPFDMKGQDLSVAMVDPTDFKALEAIEFIARKKNYKIKHHVISQAGFRNATKQYATLSAEVEEALEGTGKGPQPDELEEMLGKEKGMEEVVKTAPVSKMVSVVLRHAVEANASDIHIEPVENETRVRYRIDGILHTSLILPKYVYSSIVARIKVMSNLKLDETRMPQDGRFRMTIDGRDIDYRVSTLPLVTDEKVVMRILDRSAVVLDLEKLGFEGKDLKVMRESISHPVGLILLTGPTGSGKSTTLSAMLSIINDESINIVTLEDPVEYFLNGVNQSQINPGVGLTFASGLRSILRQDPDIIMVGEIRDSETAELAIHASLTGHLVLSTLHTNDSFGAIPRLIDMKIEPFLITASLTTVVAQRLVRRLCQYCKAPVKVPEKLEEELFQKLENLPADSGRDLKKLLKRPLTFYQGKGCARCEHTGYKGRILINEILAITDKMRKVIVTNATIDAIREAALGQGMISVEQDGILKALEQKTTLEEVIRVTSE